MKKEFTTEELLMIRGVVKSYLKERQGLDEYKGNKAMKEDLNAYEKLLKGDYRSKVNPNAISGKLFALKARYNFELTYSDKKYTASNIHKILYYALREDLKGGKLNE